jgi:hypothetical protein
MMIASAIKNAYGEPIAADTRRENFAKRNHRRVERHAHHFGMPGVAIANLLVCRIDSFAAGIAGLDRVHALQAVEHRFDAPEAAAAQGCDFGAGRRLRGRHCKILPGESIRSQIVRAAAVS